MKKSLFLLHLLLEFLEFPLGFGIACVGFLLKLRGFRLVLLSLLGQLLLAHRHDIFLDGECSYPYIRLFEIVDPISVTEEEPKS